MSKLGSDLIAGMNEAVAFSSGDKTGAVVQVLKVPDVRTIGRGLLIKGRPEQ